MHHHSQASGRGRGRNSDDPPADPPAKRQKTSGNPGVSWPAMVVPVEIFAKVGSFLLRSQLQELRLVNHEFDNKISPFLFRNVVLRLRPEMYGLAAEDIKDINDVELATMLQQRGMELFRSFGSHVRKFGMSFELNPSALHNPPKKADNELIKKSGGSYLWPSKEYNTFEHLGALQRIAADAQAMATAQVLVSRTNELGLSVDGGLGWLAGADINFKVRPPPNGLPVFEDFGDASRQAPANGLVVGRSVPSRAQNDLWEEMLRLAGYQAMDHDIALEDIAQDPRNIVTGPQTATRYQLPALYPAPGGLSAQSSSKKMINAYPLKPNKLTTDQEQMLLEIRWAQASFMSSYTLGIINNLHTFESVHTLTIARLPSAHLGCLKRHDFWMGLPNLETFNLAVIPDWRQVSQIGIDKVATTHKKPSLAVNEVYDLLQTFVAIRPKITGLSFEWLCGGEQAPGSFSRNQHILAAPLVASSTNMISRLGAFPVLTLPFIRFLTMKNCWASPHILQSFLKATVPQLETLMLDSVSLCGYVPRKTIAVQPLDVFPDPVQVHVDQTQGGYIQGGHIVPAALHTGLPYNGAAAPVGPAAQQSAPIILMNSSEDTDDDDEEEEETDEPKTASLGSWAEIIDMIAPTNSLATDVHGFAGGPEPSRDEERTLKKIEFNSCGYVYLPLQINDIDFDESEEDRERYPRAIAWRRSYLQSDMQISQDCHLAHIVNRRDLKQEQKIKSTWGLTFGWSRATLAKLRPEVAADGIQHPGRGRFRGIIAAPPPTSGSL